MSDVAAPCIANNPFKFAPIVMGTRPTGVSAKYNDTTDDTKAITPSGYFLKLGDRFDNPTYYSN